MLYDRFPSMASPVDQHVSYNRISKEIVCVIESKHRMYNLGAMGCRIDPSCLTTGVTKTVVCVILTMGWCI